MLFLPWRDTDKLRGEESSYTEPFRKKLSDLEDAIIYHDKISKIREAREQMNALIEKEMIDNNKETQQDQDVFPDGCIPIETEMAMKDFQDLADNLIVDGKDLENAIAQFNSDQERVFQKKTSTMTSESDEVL